MSSGHPDEKKGQYQGHPPPSYQPQGQGYPMQQPYPAQTAQYPQYAMPPQQQQQQQGYPGQQPMYPQAGPPPPYTAAPHQNPAYPQQVPVQYLPQQQTVMAPGAFDAGARFGVGSSVNIPPPPPGVAPNAAQVASMQGQNVVVGQRKGDWLSGGSDGGYVWW